MLTSEEIKGKGKIHNSIAPQRSPMAKLTARQEKFCQCIADGMNQSDAYRAAYTTEKMSDRVLWIKASQTASLDKVKIRVTELKENLANKQLWTRERSVLILANIADNAEKPSDVTAAIKELNAMHGYNAPSKHEVITNPLVLVLKHGTDDSTD
jgi:vacuolar-type H+-ATPase subunit B/Vma2